MHFKVKSMVANIRSKHFCFIICCKNTAIIKSEILQKVLTVLAYFTGGVICDDVTILELHSQTVLVN